MPNFGSHLSGPVRHKGQKPRQTNRSWYSNLPIGMNDPDFVHELNDFIKLSDYTAADYTLTTVGTTMTASVNQTTSPAVNGTLALATDATNPSSLNLQSKVNHFKLDNTITANTHALQSFKRTWFEASISTSANDTDVFIGLSEQATDVFASNNYVGFRISNGSLVVSYVNAKAGVASSASAQSGGSGNAFTATAGTLFKVGFLFDGSNAIHFFINRNYMATVTANIPTVDMALVAKIKSNSANARTMNIDYVYICKDR